MLPWYAESKFLWCFLTPVLSQASWKILRIQLELSQLCCPLVDKVRSHLAGSGGPVGLPDMIFGHECLGINQAT